MGIPSFYRHLCRRFPALVNRGPGPAPEWLCLDFNCAMYHVLRTYAAEHPYTSTGSKQWETGFADAIAAYMGELVRLAAPTKGVYVSCDGVVCAAKRKQQRLRRFKGPWTSQAEAEIRGSSPESEERWDQNALTPGTAFMDLLGTTLTTAGRHLQAKTKLRVTVSTTAEPGEGEHKLLAHMRAERPATCTIYGLDADLILLAMLLRTDTGADVRLMREAQEFETGRRPTSHINTGSASGFEKSSGSNEWRNLHVSQLMSVMMPAHGVRDFVATMSLLGNDFLPRSLTQTVRDDGIPRLIGVLKAHVWSKGLRIVGADGTLQREALLILMDVWAASETADMLVAAKDAVKAANRPPPIGENDKETALMAWNALPAQWATLTRILAPCRTRLINGWQRVYRETWHAGSADAYLRGVAWTWDYYNGRPVDLGWAFTEHLPPLWSDVRDALRLGDGAIQAPPLKHTTPLPAWLHLLSVLPVNSAKRLLKPEHQKALTSAPHYWPTTWSLFDVGRTQMWECEPVIPVIPETVLRSWV
jgi:5'-3' exonuclease